MSDVPCYRPLSARTPSRRAGEPLAFAAGRLSAPNRALRDVLESRPDGLGRLAPRRRGWASAVLRGEAGQSSVELAALLPLALLVGLAILTLLAARSASGQAAAAAQAGAMALLQDAEPRAAARAALPPDAWPRATIQVQAQEVIVTVAPATRVPFLADTLTATASAHAGPAPR
jgi:hypothetical protein